MAVQSPSASLPDVLRGANQPDEQRWKRPPAFERHRDMFHLFTSWVLATALNIGTLGRTCQTRAGTMAHKTRATTIPSQAGIRVTIFVGVWA